MACPGMAATTGALIARMWAVMPVIFCASSTRLPALYCANALVSTPAENTSPSPARTTGCSGSCRSNAAESCSIISISSRFHFGRLMTTTLTPSVCLNSIGILRASVDLLRTRRSRHRHCAKRDKGNGAERLGIVGSDREHAHIGRTDRTRNLDRLGTRFETRAVGGRQKIHLQVHGQAELPGRERARHSCAGSMIGDARNDAAVKIPARLHHFGPAVEPHGNLPDGHLADAGPDIARIARPAGNCLDQLSQLLVRSHRRPPAICYGRALRSKRLIVRIRRYRYYRWMDFRQIRYLVAVADAGSFTAGAKRAFVAQPTLSAAIAALEKELGTKLFERQARGVALTAEGQRAVSHARNVLKAIQEMRHDKPAIGARRIRLGLLPTLPPGLPAEIVSRLAFLNPEIEYSCEDAPLAVL